MSEEKIVLSPCEKCGLAKTSCVGIYSAKRVMGVGPKNAKIMFIGEALGQEEVIQNTQWVGSNAKKLKDACDKAGINIEETYRTTVVKCRPPENRPPKNSEIKECMLTLLEEIKEVKPKIIVPLGGVALEAILKRKGIQSIRGTPFPIEIEGIKSLVIATYSPAFILKWPEYKDKEEQFYTDIRTIKEASEVENYQKKKMDINYVTTRSIEPFLAYIEEIKKVKKFAYDIETTGFEFLTDTIISIGLSKKSGEAVTLYVKDLSSNQFNLVLTKLQEILESREILKIAQNGKFDNKFFMRKGIQIKLPYFDTMIAHFLLDENSEHGLKANAWRYTDMGGYEEPMEAEFKRLCAEGKKVLETELKEKLKNGEITKEEYTIELKERYELLKNYGLIEPEMLMHYNCADADCTYRLYEIFEPKLRSEGIWNVFDLILMPLQYCLTEVEYKGIQIDKEYMEHFRTELIAKIKDIMFTLMSRSEVLEVEKGMNIGVAPDAKTYKKFNINSNLQLQTLLFKVAKLQPVEKTKTGYSTDKFTLETLARSSEIARMILEYRKYNHDYVAYVKQLSRSIDVNGRAHTDYKIHGAVTGRIISAQPNLQNIPRKSNVKFMFVADPGCVLVSADYKQVEYRVWANYANDPVMLQDIANDLDIHSDISCVVWPDRYENLGNNKYLFKKTGEIKGKVGDEDRVVAKGVVFGLMFGRGVKSLCEEFNISEQEANAIIRWFFGKYPAANEWINDQKKLVRKYKKVINLFGRVRRLPEVDSKEESKRAEVDRQCINTPIQSGAADICSIATTRVYNAMHRVGLHSRMVLNIHDSLKYSVPINEIDSAIQCMKDGMTAPIKGVNFPLKIDIEVGRSWGDLIELHEFNQDREKYLAQWRVKV